MHINNNTNKILELLMFETNNIDKQDKQTIIIYNNFDFKIHLILLSQI